MFIMSTPVPADVAEEFLSIAAKPHGSYAGFERFFVCRGKEYAVDTRYDNELQALGLIKPEPAHG